MCVCTGRCMKCQHIVLLIRCCNFGNDEFSFFKMKNIYEYIHYIQSLKSIWTKMMMSTWGCYFRCVFLIFFFLNLFFNFVSLLPCEVCIIFFLKKNIECIPKNDKKPMLIPDFLFFLRRFQKWKQKIQKSFKEFSEVFFFFFLNLFLFFIFFPFASRRRKKKSRDGYS